MLAVLVLHGDTLATTQALALGRNVLVDNDLLETDEVTHVGVATALLRFLRGLLHEADFVGVLSCFSTDALALERTEDIINAPILGKILLVGLLVFLGLVEILACRVNALLGFFDGFALAGVVAWAVCEDSVLNERYAQFTQFAVEPSTDRWREVVLEFVDWMHVSKASTGVTDS